MALQTVDAALLRKMFLAGAKNLESKKEIINEAKMYLARSEFTEEEKEAIKKAMTVEEEIEALTTPDETFDIE